MTRVCITVLVSAVLTGIIGYFLLPLLRALKAGQSIREIGPTWHNSKAGTPMMGGLMFIASLVICLLVQIPSIRPKQFITYWAWACALALWAFWMTFLS